MKFLKKQSSRKILYSFMASLAVLCPLSFSPTLAQAIDYNNQIEQQETEMRRLTGKVEEMGFQIRQLEDKFQRLSKETDFRLKELEDRSDASTSSSVKKGSTPVPVSKGDPKPLGSRESVSKSTTDTHKKSDDSEGEDAGHVYEQSLSAYNQKDYAKAQSGFQNFLETSSVDPLASNAYYWLGETYYAQKQYKDAAGSFLEGYRKFPQGNKAPHNLYRLGATLFQLGKKQEGCATLKEAKQRVEAGADEQKAILLKRIEQIQQKNTCS
jgi:tol-pal system protein YbgF